MVKITGSARIPSQFNIGPLQVKIQEARAKGVPESDINRVLQNNAMKARDAKVRGAFMQAGLKGIGTVQSNLAQGIGQAGLNNASFSPTQSALGGLGDAAAARGQADAELAGEQSRIARDDLARTDRLTREGEARQLERDKLQADKDKEQAAELKDKNDLIKVQQKQMALAEEAILELGKGAGEVLNFAVSREVIKVIRASAIAIPRLSGLTTFDTHGYIEETKPEVINEWFQGNNQQALNAFSRMKNAVYQMYVEARKQLQGQGQITEKESGLIYETVASLTHNSDAVAASLQRMINVLSKELGIAPKQVPYSPVPPFSGTAADVKKSVSIGDGIDQAAQLSAEAKTQIQAALDGKDDGKTPSGQTEAPLVTPQIELPPTGETVEEPAKEPASDVVTDIDSLSYTKISDAELPADIKKELMTKGGKSKFKNRRYHSDNGYVYILQDDGVFSKAFWKKSTKKYGGANG